ncbi:MAG: hypothetical protein Greene041619_1011 [Candidatus Peregrinibacteria bacterium Greene0416_19]|nr:MAG: hypothetical protein Greene041619_1011 [Candidatus Peregrinibacteria bacterium Greene0416_19]
MELLRSARAFAAEHDDLPAFHAGFLVLSFFVAILLNLGAFAFVILVHMALDLVFFRDVQLLSWSRALRAVTRENLPDIALFLAGLTVAILLHERTGIVALGAGLMRSGMEVARGLLLLLPKLAILRHLRSTLQDVSRHLAESRRSANRPWGKVELAWAFIAALASVTLAIAPILLPFRMEGVAAILADELIPWRL